MASAVEDYPTAAVANNDLIIVKLIAILVLGVTSFLLGILPIKLTKLISIKAVEGDKNLILSLLLCFGGGVLLFTTFIHLQPEVRESFESLSDRDVVPNMIKGIPISELVFCFGFFFVYLIEEIVHFFLDRKIHNEALHRSLSVRKCSNNEVSIPRVTLTKFDDGNISYISNSNKELLNSQTAVDIEKHSHGHHSLPESIKNSFGGFVAVLALSFHAVFEGLAVGLEDSVEKVWYLFAAIATHKLVIAFCVGVELVTSKTRNLLVVLYIGTFAIVTPIGIGAGIVVSEKAESLGEDLTSVVLQGMAAGTLLYVVFFEVLARERDNRHNGLCQLLAICAGFACMFTLQILLGHEHSHGHGGHDHGHGHENHDHLHESVHDHLEATTHSHLHEHTQLYR